MGLLRLWLAFSVVLMHSHSFYGFTGIGGYAVPAFFVMSGFYMNLILTTKYRGTTLRREGLPRSLKSEINGQCGS